MNLFSNILKKNWGPYTFDRFADCNNFKVSKFNSQFWCPGTSGVDAFAYDWSNYNNWIVPPVHYIPNVLNHMLYYKCYGTLVVSKWMSALFWPCIALNNVEFQWYVRERVEYVKPKNFFATGSQKESIFAKSPFISNVLVLKIDCKY